MPSDAGRELIDRLLRGETTAAENQAIVRHLLRAFPGGNMPDPKKKPSPKKAAPRDPRIRSRVPLLEKLSPELRDLLVFFLDAVLHLDQTIERYREREGKPRTKGGRV